MRIKILFIICLLLMISTFQLQAQFKDSSLGIGVMVGGSKLRGDIDNTNAGFTSGILLKYAPVPNFAIAATGTYSKLTSGLDAIKTDLYNASLFASYFFMPGKLFNPSVSLGYSKFYYFTMDENNELLYNSIGSASKGWENSLQLGIGVELMASNSWAINTMGSYNLTQIDALDAIIDGSNDSFFNGTIALVHYFNTGQKLNDKNNLPRSKNNLEVEQIKSNTTQSSIKTSTDNPEGKSGSFSSGIYFEPGTAKLLETSYEQLNKIYEYLVTNPNEEIQLLGKTDKKNKSVNHTLIVDRAKSIKAYLVNKGVTPGRIIIDGAM